MTHTAADLLVPLNLFSPSPTNPRSRISAAELRGLAESIAAHQVMQPILARPLPGAVAGQAPLEIVAGHRRWHACIKLTAEGRNPHGESIPALQRDLTDAQVLAMQLVENIQREDLHPLDEAEHYRRMREDPAAPASVEDIAECGKVSASRVYERLSLLHLVPPAREAFLAEKLSLKTALQVARMPAELQAEVTQHLADWGGEPMTPKAAAAFIHERYMLRLAQAPFDAADATLLPQAGACGTCPKRTGANPQLFGDISDADTCTDTTCFAAKKAAQRARMVDELRISGYTVLEGDQARDACTPDGRALKPGLHALEAHVPHALGDAAMTIVDVLTQANAPNAHTRVVDHPGNQLLVYAVPTAELEGALRKIKAHRAQLDKAAAKQQRTAAAAPAPEPEPQRAATPATSSHRSAQAQAQDPDEPVSDERHDALVQELLAFTPPPTSAGRYNGHTADQYAADQYRRAMGILVAASAAQAMKHDRAEGLPEYRMAHMLLALLAWGESYIGDADACRLCGIEPPDFKGSGLRFLMDKEDWLWSLPNDQAERLAMTLLAAQEHNGKTPLQHFAAAVCQGLSIDAAALTDAAHASVQEHMQLGALKQGDAAAKKTRPGASKGKAPANGSKARTPTVAYRDARTGETWSGRGLMPKWLKVRMENGQKLEEFRA